MRIYYASAQITPGECYRYARRVERQLREIKKMWAALNEEERKAPLLIRDCYRYSIGFVINDDAVFTIRNAHRTSMMMSKIS